MNKSQHTKLTLEKKILTPLLPEFELATFRSRVRRCDQQAIPAPRLSDIALVMMAVVLVAVVIREAVIVVVAVVIVIVVDDAVQ